MIKNKVQKVFKYNFVKDTITLQIGTFVSTGLSFVASVVFARFLGPDNYGQYVLIFAYTGLIGIFMNWGADNATLTLLAEAWAKRDKKEILNLIIFFVKISTISSLSVGLLTLIFSPVITGQFYHDHLIGELSRFIILAGILRFMFFLLTIVLQSARKIKYLTILENINKFVYILIPVSLVVFGFGLRGVVWGHFVSAFIFLVLSIIIYRSFSHKTDLLPSLKDIISGMKNQSIKKYFNFGFSVSIDKNLATLYSTIPFFFFGMFVDTAGVGYFKIASSYLGLSLVFLKPISRLLVVQLPKSKTYGFTKLKKHFVETSFFSFIIVMVVIIPMLLLARFLVTTFYGEQYLGSLKTIYLLWPYFLASAWGVGLGSLLRTLNKMKVSILVNFLVLLITTPLVYLAIRTYGVIGMIISMIAWSIIPTFIMFIYSLIYLNKKDNNV